MMRTYRTGGITRTAGLMMLVTLFAFVSCARSRAIIVDGPGEPTVKMVTASSNGLGWNGIRLGMTRMELERKLHSGLTVRPDEGVALCGPFYSTQRLAGRDVYVQWSSDGDDGRVELIHVPLIGTERTMSAERLAAIAAERVSGLVDAREEPFADASQSAHLVLRDHPEMSLLLKPGAPDEALYVSYRTCID